MLRYERLLTRPSWGEVMPASLSAAESPRGVMMLASKGRVENVLLCYGYYVGTRVNSSKFPKIPFLSFLKNPLIVSENFIGIRNRRSFPIFIYRSCINEFKFLKVLL